MKLRRSSTPEKANDFVVPDDEDKLISWLDKKLDAGRRDLPKMAMKMNLAYVLGHQFIVWDPQSRAFVQAKTKNNDPNAPVRIKANKVGGIVERFIARLTKSAPETQCRPVTDDENDINAAKAGTRIIQSELNRLQWEDWLVRHYFWPTTHGFAYAQIVWDPNGGQEIGTVVSEGSTKGKSVKEGLITLESVPGFELVVDPSAVDMLTAKWAVRTKTLTREAVWEAYGQVPAGASPERTIADEVNALSAGSSDDLEENIAIHQLWMVPCRAAPEGLVVTWSGTTILEAAKPFPYKHKRLPFVQFDLLPGLGSRLGRTWVDDLIPLQADYNDARSREATLRRTLTPKLVSPTGSIDPNAIGSRVEVIPYAPVGDKPAWMIPDSGWMAQHETAMNRADMEMGDRAGQSDVSSGKPSSASMPAAAILALQEADDTKLAITYKLMAAAIKETSWHILELVRQFWTEERLVRTWSEEGAIEVRHFSGADVSRQLDIHVNVETGVARSKSAMTQLAMELWSAGVITDPRHLLRLIKVPGADFLAEAWNIDSRQAQRENEYLQLGQSIEINTFDNHMVHLTEHDNLRKGEEYAKIARRASEGDPEAIAIKANIDGHAQAHYELVMQQLGVPTPPGSDFNPEAAAAGSLGGGEYIDPTTGMPPNPTMVAAGATPSALSDSSIAKRAGIGGPGQPGQVPGIDADTQAARQGA